VIIKILWKESRPLGYSSVDQNMTSEAPPPTATSKRLDGRLRLGFLVAGMSEINGGTTSED
jgi:hypothetical protein